MKRFLKKIAIFFVLFGLIFLVGILLPATPASKANMLAYKPVKDSLLHSVEGPRIVFVGGSNLVFGLNSGTIKKELSLNPVNAGLAINFGLIFMLDDMKSKIKEGDIVIVAPEYQHFFGKQAFGGNDLLRLILDVQPEATKILRKEHLPNLIKGIPVYVQSKFSLGQYFYSPENDVYSKFIFNEYGDSDFHWNLPKREFPDVNPIRGAFNASLIKELEEFEREVEDHGGKLYVTFPGCHDLSMSIMDEQVQKVNKALVQSKLTILGTPNRYAMKDDMMFDQIYHLSKKGVDRRTELLIRDLQGSPGFAE